MKICLRGVKKHKFKETERHETVLNIVKPVK